MTRLLLMRHGQTDWNTDGRYQGQVDVPLNDLGRNQAAQAAPFVAGLRPDRIIASPLSRAVDTAGAVAGLTGHTVVTDPRLKEIHVGSWQGRVVSDIFAEDPGFERALIEHRDYRRSPTGETTSELGERVSAALREFAGAFPNSTTLCVSHGVAIRMGVGYLLGGWDVAAQLGVLHNCHWAELQVHQGRWRLNSYDAGVLGSLLEEPDY